MNVWMNEKDSKRVDRSHQKLTCVGVEPTTLWELVHRSTIFAINPSYISNILLKLRGAQFNFLIAILCKCSYDIQEEDIYIKPWSIEFQV